MHLDCALAVAEVVHLLLSQAVDVAEYRREIVVGHVLEGEFPELLILVRI